MVFTGYGNEEEQNLEDLLSDISEPDEASSTKVKWNNPVKRDVTMIFALLLLFFCYMFKFV